MNPRTWHALVAVLLVQHPLSAPVSAQVATAGPGDGHSARVRWEWGGNLAMAQSVGQFAEYVGGGGGFGLFGIRYLGEGTAFGLRLDLTLLSYGKTTASYEIVLAGTPVDVDVTTENVIATLALGPHVVFGRGRVRPYVGASIGSAQFVTTNAAWAGGRAVPVTSGEVFERHVWALSVGGGVRVTFRELRAHPVALELDGRYGDTDAWSTSAREACAS